ncbi:MAG: hypothetical protein RLZZ70_162 [Candidatus Parcubacteria bacterium]|jgi:hypothetical protein
MKKFLIIGVIGTILTIVVAFWVYSFLYGNPNNSAGMFSNLGIFEADNSVPLDTEIPRDTTTETPPVDALRQLTTKAVVGVRLLTTGTSTVARLVEAGTGHVFDINLATGNETRRSGISIPVASEAAVSPSGNYVAIRSGYNNQNELIVLDLTTADTPKRIILPNQVESFAFVESDELVFTEFVGGQTEGKGYMPSTGITRRLFTAPFTAHRMSWSEGNTPHLIFTKPARNLRGFVYEVTSSGLKRLTVSGEGLTVLHSSEGYLFGRTNSNSYETGYVNRNDNTISGSAIATLPDKCVYGGVTNTWYCASALETNLSQYPDEWYKGGQQFDDRLWQIDTTGRATQLVNPLQAAGRSLDVTNLAIDPTLTMLYFLNKTDKSLWVYEL